MPVYNTLEFTLCTHRIDLVQKDREKGSTDVTLFIINIFRSFKRGHEVNCARLVSPPDFYAVQFRSVDKLMFSIAEIRCFLNN